MSDPSETPQAPNPQPRGFFHSLRWSGWFRAEPRVIGGVCSGAAARLGWDVALVRGVTIIAAILFTPIIALYGFLWLLLPEQRDGRIHLQELVEGRFDGAQLGAFLLILISLSSFFPKPFFFSSSFSAFFGILGFLFFVTIGFIIFFAVRNGRSSSIPNTSSTFHNPYGGIPSPMSSPNQHGTPGAHMPNSFGAPAPGSHAGTPQTPNAPAPENRGTYAMGSTQPAPAPWQSTARPTSGYSPQGYGQASPMPTPPRQWNPPRTRVRVVSLRESLIVTGLVVLAMATTFFLMYHTSLSDGLSQEINNRVMTIGLIGGGVCLLIAGLALVSASLRDRGAGWLIALSIIGMFLAGPTALVGGAWHVTEDDSWSSFSRSEVNTAHYGWQADIVSSDSSSGHAELDLSNAPESVNKTITVDPSTWAALHVIIRPDQPVRVICEGTVFDVSAPDLRWTDALDNCDPTDEGTVAVQSPRWSKDRGITLLIPANTSLDWLTLAVDDTVQPLDEPQSEAVTPSSPQSPQSSSSATSASPTTELTRTNLAFSPFPSPSQRTVVSSVVCAAPHEIYS
ncbi:PspC domain-containing protein [Schaalia sp. ZJ1691]|uniref:PspC domain-containing protein n=1 Tax=Schaalia sp. ZJ1691 TaxID=2709404 RepID=UPI0013EB0044|nr:PspC domain-containing protein [Schaalia sp. ZJ1691]